MDLDLVTNTYHSLTQEHLTPSWVFKHVYKWSDDQIKQYKELELEDIKHQYNISRILIGES